jgi:hypothetical protein
MMFEVEGGTHDRCMQLMRHECAHAIDNAYRLRRRKKFRETFGRASEPYRGSYAPKISSREYVQNLDAWYAQSHPLEDFAETFAVWLQPRAIWLARYAGWPAMRKLDCVDDMMSDIANEPAPVRTRARPDAVSRLSMTLREFYQERKAGYVPEVSEVYDEPLARLFSSARTGSRRKAAGFLLKQRRSLRNAVADVTGQYRYVVDQVLKSLIVRCRELDLRLARPDHETRLETAILLTAMTARILRGRRAEFRR